MEKDIDYIVRRLKEIHGNKVEIKYIENEKNYEVTISYKKDDTTTIENVVRVEKYFSSVGNVICEISKIIDNFIKNLIKK